MSDFDLLGRMRVVRARLYQYPLRPSTRLGYDPMHAYYLGEMNGLYKVAVSLGLADQARQIVNAKPDEAKQWE